MLFQTTVLNTVRCKGIGLHSGIATNLTIRPAEVDSRLTVIGPEIEHAPGKLTAIVDENAHRRSTLRDQTVAGLDDVFRSKAFADNDVERFARVHIDDGQGSEPRAIDELVGDEIHRPRLVRSLRDVTLPSSDRHLASAWPFTA